MDLLISAYNLSFIICSLYAIFVFIKNGIKWNNVFGMYIIVMAIVEVVILFLIKNTNIERNTIALIYKIVFLFTYLCVLIIYINIQLPIFKKLSLSIGLLTLLFLIFSGELTHTYFNTTYGVSISLFIIIICLIWYINKIADVSSLSIFSDPFFWFTTGLFLWSAVFLLRILPAEFIQNKDENFMNLLRILNYVVNLVSNTLFFVGLYKSKQYSKLKLNSLN